MTGVLAWRKPCGAYTLRFSKIRAETIPSASGREKPPNCVMDYHKWEEGWAHPTLSARYRSIAPAANPIRFPAQAAKGGGRAPALPSPIPTASASQ